MKNQIKLKNRYTYFYLHQACVPVLGNKQAIIIDTQRNDFIISPLYIAEKLFKCKNNALDIEFIEEEFLEYLNELVYLEYGFYTNCTLNLLPVKENFFSINSISNSIIDFAKKSNYDWRIFLNFLDINGCSSIMIRIFDSIDFEKLELILLRLNNSSVRSIDISINYFNSANKYIENDLCKYAKINKIIIYNSPISKVNSNSCVNIIYLKQQLVDETHCGFVDPIFFTNDYKFINESKLVNNCLYKKISIDKNGKVKTCPASSNTICDVKDIEKTDVLFAISKLPETTITKDNIEVCRDCEYRYICHDCRVFTQKNNLFSKPSKCTYDPYSCIWT